MFFGVVTIGKAARLGTILEKITAFAWVGLGSTQHVSTNRRNVIIWQRTLASFCEKEE